MTVSELIQQQRAILRAYHTAVVQYHQPTSQAKERLERELAQIQKERNAAEQEAKQEYERVRDGYIAQILKVEKKMEEDKPGGKQAREQLRAKLLSERDKMITESIPTMAIPVLNDTDSVRREIRKTGISTSTYVLEPLLIVLGELILISSPLLVIFIDIVIPNMFLVVAASASLGGAALLGIGYILRIKRREKTSSDLARLAGLYRHWLELIAQQAQTQEAQAQEAYRRMLEQAKQQLVAAQQQLAPAAVEYTSLADQACPPWGDAAWQAWQPGTLPAGMVRLGVFIPLQPDVTKPDRAELVAVSPVSYGDPLVCSK